MAKVKVKVRVIEEKESIRGTVYSKKRLLIDEKEVTDYNNNRIRRLAEILGFSSQGDLYKKLGISLELADKLGWSPEDSGFNWSSSWSGFYRFLQFMGLENSTLEEKVKLIIDIHEGRVALSPDKEKNTLYEKEIEIPKRNLRNLEDDEEDYED